MKRKGFTLIELLVVVAIIALLLSILMPSLTTAKEHARRLSCATHQKTIGVAIAMYANQQKDKLPMNLYQHELYRRDSANAVATYFLGKYSDKLHNNSTPQERLKDMLSGVDYLLAVPLKKGGITNLGYLMSTGLLQDAEQVLYCDSSNPSSRYSYNAYGGKSQWPKGLDVKSDNPYSIRISYSYLPQARQRRHPHPRMSSFPDAAYKLSELDPNLSMVIDLLNGNEMSHKRKGYYGVNMLFGDGSVVFKLDEDNVIKDGGDLIGKSDVKTNDPGAWRNAIRILERR